jgi:hypothetical protein
LYNNADDNTLSYVNDNYEKLIDIHVLEKESSVLIDWFKFNCMQARVGKKAGNTHISQDGGKYWEIRLILNLQI